MVTILSQKKEKQKQPLTTSHHRHTLFRTSSVTRVADDKQQGGRSYETDDPFTNPIDAENRTKGENINVKARIVLLDSERDAVGDWDSNEKVPAVVLHLFFHNNPYENRIDVRITHRWGEGSKKQAPAAEKMFFRVYADQIRYLKKRLIVKTAKFEPHRVRSNDCHIFASLVWRY